MEVTANTLPERGDLAAKDAAAVQPASTATEKRAKAAAEKFEAFFIAEMMRQMRRSARAFGDDSRRDRPADEMLDVSYNQVADTLAGQHAFGVADLILKQILPGQAVAPSGKPEI